MKSSGYSYAIVRYVHDVVSGECLNVAIVLLAGQNVHCRIPASLMRVKGAFPNASVGAIREGLKSLAHNLERIAANNPRLSLSEIIEIALPPDESAFQISRPGVGLAKDASEAADELLERFVLRCDDFEFAEIINNFETRKAWGTRIGLHSQLLCVNDDEWEDEPKALRA